MDLAKYRQTSYDTWQQMAPAWERRRQEIWDFTHPVSENMVARLDPQPGEVLLELACGTGETGCSVAGRLGDDGKLIATDFAPGMVEAAQRRAQELGITNADVRVMDAEQMDLPDDSIDGVLCRFGYMLMPDAAAALTETRRVLRDGGRLVFAVWAPADRNPWAAMSAAALVQLGHMPMPEPGAPGIFSMGTEERITELVTGAGFGAPQIEEIPLEASFDSSDDYLGFVEELSGQVSITLAKLRGDERVEANAAIERNIEPYRSNGGYALPGVALSVLVS